MHKFCGQITCACKKNCANKIGILRQEELFDAFYALPNWSQKTLFLRSLAERSHVQPNLNPIINIKNRHFLSEYFLSDSRQKKRKICLSFILKVLQISKSRMFRALESQKSNPNAIDHRGKFASRKTEREHIEFAKSVIQSISSFESKYKTSSETEKYFPPNLNLKKVYNIYQEQCQLNERKEVSPQIFRRIFRNSFNLKFLKRCTSKCELCKELQIQMRA